MTIGDGLLESLAAVGATDRTSARFWVRADPPGELELVIRGDGGADHGGLFTVPFVRETDFTTSVRYPHDFPGGRPLSPGVRYRWAIRRNDDGSFLGEGALETSPASIDSAPDEMSFAVLSCHEPFDDHGAIRPECMRMLRAAGPALEEHRVKRVLMVGDQVYSDYPRHCSLFDEEWFRRVGPSGRPSIFDCTREEVRAMYHQRYRAFWAMPEFQALMQQWPCYMMFDDHDIVENFGTRLEHSAAIWRSVHDGALDAALDYQGLRVRGRGNGYPESFHFQLEYGPIALFMMDLRSQRGWIRGRYQVYGDDQHRELERFLDENRERPVVLLGLSVPLVHVPEWMPAIARTMLAEGNDFDDRWEAEVSRCDRERLVKLLNAHQRRCPEQRLIMIAGDIHVGLVNKIEWDDGCPPCYQLVSSAVSNIMQPYIQKGASLLARIRMHMEGRLPGASIDLLHRSGMKNPYDRLNIGLVKVTREDGEWKTRLILLGHDRREPPLAKVVFESEPI